MDRGQSIEHAAALRKSIEDCAVIVELGETMPVRSVKGVLKEATRDGDPFIAPMINLPGKVFAHQSIGGYANVGESKQLLRNSRDA